MGDEPTVGLIGAGALAGALVDGLVAAGMPPGRLWITNRSDGERLARFRGLGLQTTEDKAELVAAADLLVLLVKPKDAKTALAELAGCIGPRHRVLSCMAGISTAFVEGALGNHPRVLRAMPNIGSAVRTSATALVAGHFALPADMRDATGLLAAVGDVVPVEEGMMDAVTAVAGSGPAYVYLLMEALAEAAAAVGLPEAIASRLILQTVVGAAKYAVASGDGPAVLRRAVSSPGGTTVAGIAALEAGGFRQTMAAAVTAATERSRELGRPWEA